MENEKKEVQKKPNALLYNLACILARPYVKWRFNFSYTGEKPKGPCIILSNHTSNTDFLFLAEAVFPERITFLASYHWFTFKNLAKLLNAVGVIPKYQFANDMTSLKKMRSCIDKSKGCVYIAPEGTIYSGGQLGHISPAIAKMIRFFRCPVYACLIEGAGLGNAKWSKDFHKGKVCVNTKLIVSKEECAKISVDEIMTRIKESLSYDDFEFQKKFNVKVKGDDKLDGFDNMFYKCPKCGKEFTLHSEKNSVECTSCGVKAEIGTDFRFKWVGSKQYFDNYVQWYNWQLDEMKKVVSSPDFSFTDEVEYRIDRPGENEYVLMGKGTMTLDSSGWTYKGFYDGEEIEEHDELETVFLATLKCGKFFELPFKNGHCRAFYPIENGKKAMLWHLASRAISEVRENN